ncbi:hypothetical protein ABZS29_18315 [Kribbella sp. NPDC005582]|uniref:hypothetical protein n=1 Tax=Kribbella sp. NPDC005582 TaxID=3156893 RepID=UPI00339DAB02
MNRTFAAGLAVAGLAGVLGACGTGPADSPAPVSSQIEEGAELGPTAVRILTLGSTTEGGSRLAVVGPDGAKYRIRIGKTVEPCTQTNGSVDATPRHGLPPNAVHNVALSCPGGGDRKHLLSVGTLLVTVVAGPDFNYDFEVPFRRDVKA